MSNRKVEGEGKDTGHGDGHGTFDGTSVPFRRWEDWERSRLRKLRREERRRREVERAFPQGFPSDPNNMLYVRKDILSQYDGSDTLSVASSDDDAWGVQIGGYNENSPQYPPPPTGVLMPKDELLATADTVDANEMEAMLQSGFGPDSARPSQDNIRNASSTNLLSQSNSAHGLPTFQPADGSSRFNNTYAPLSRQDGPLSPPPNRHVMSPVSPFVPSNGTSSAVGAMHTQTHARKRSAGRGGDMNEYGPLGPLDPGTRI